MTCFETVWKMSEEYSIRIRKGKGSLSSLTGNSQAETDCGIGYNEYYT